VAPSLGSAVTADVAPAGHDRTMLSATSTSRRSFASNMPPGVPVVAPRGALTCPKIGPKPDQMLAGGSNPHSCHPQTVIGEIGAGRPGAPDQRPVALAWVLTAIATPR
jgi:hypothetical protein